MAAATLTANCHWSIVFGSKRERQEPAGLGPWPSVFSLATIRQCDQKQLAEGRACLTCSPHHSPSLGETEAGTQGRAGMWGRGHGRTLFTGLLSLTQPRATCCGAVPPTGGLGPSTQPLIRRRPCRFSNRPTRCWHFLS